jgi:hypothetical protein
MGIGQGNNSHFDDFDAIYVVQQLNRDASAKAAALRLVNENTLKLLEWKCKGNIKHSLPFPGQYPMGMLGSRTT